MSGNEPRRRGQEGRRWVSDLAAARGRAYARDAVGYLGIAAAMVPAGVACQLSGVPVPRPVVTLLSAVPPLVATVWAALAESGPHRATWGKRREHVVVLRRAGAAGTDVREQVAEADGQDGASRSPISFPRALLRNAVKIGIPWQIGHMVALSASYGDLDRIDAVGACLLSASYLPIMGVVVLTVLVPGRGLQDLAAGTRVRRLDVAGG